MIILFVTTTSTPGKDFISPFYARPAPSSGPGPSRPHSHQRLRKRAERTRSTRVAWKRGGARQPKSLSSHLCSHPDAQGNPRMPRKPVALSPDENVCPYPSLPLCDLDGQPITNSKHATAHSVSAFRGQYLDLRRDSPSDRRRHAFETHRKKSACPTTGIKPKIVCTIFATNHEISSNERACSGHRNGSKIP